jgi:hypothetical protein
MEKVTCTNCGAENRSTNKYCTDCGFELPKIKTEEISNSVQQPTKQSKEKKKKILTTVVYFVFFFGAYFTVQQIFFKPPSIDKLLMKTASEINKSCPFMVDQFTRLDNAMAMSDNSFQYTYTIVNLDKSQVNLDTAKKYIFPVLLNNLKTSPDMKFARDNNLTMIYYYRDPKGVFVVKYTVTPDMYK